MKIFVDGVKAEVEPSPAGVHRLHDRLVIKTDRGAETAVAVRKGDAVLVSFRGMQYKVERKRPRSTHHGAAASGELRAPMPGQIVDVLLQAGAAVSKGDKILVLEAMKTQQPFVAPFDGVLERVEVAKGDQVGDGALLALVREGSAG